jgi:PPOX class probable FMN-dependent enzyme
VSPRGDPPGFALVVDDVTLALPERPGNRRVDSLRNILENPHVGLLFLVPGRGDTLRLNGTATLDRSPELLDAMVVKGHRPQLAVRVAVEAVFFHCSKAFLRSQLWEPDAWEPTAVPSRPEIAKRLERPDPRSTSSSATTVPPTPRRCTPPRRRPTGRAAPRPAGRRRPRGSGRRPQAPDATDA